MSQENIESNQSYVFIRKITGGIHAEAVALFKSSNGQFIVRKKYRPIHANIFRNEIKYLQLLADCPFVNKLIKYDESQLTMHLTYCGKPITAKQRASYASTIKKYTQLLEKKWHVYHNDLKSENICLLDGQIYFIDFGWAGSRRGNPGYGPKCLGYKGPLAKIKPNSESKDKSKYKKKKHKSKRR